MVMAMVVDTDTVMDIMDMVLKGGSYYTADEHQPGFKNLWNISGSQYCFLKKQQPRKWK